MVAVANMSGQQQDLFEKEKNDPAMIAYLKALGIDPDYKPPTNDDRRVVIQKLEIVFKDGHESAVLEVETPEQQAAAKKKPMVIKEGSEYKIRVTFRVQHTLVAGLKIISVVKKMGAELNKEEEMLGSYPPKNEFASVDIGGGDFMEAPKGAFSRGEYKAHMKFMDDDKACHLDFEYTIKISKDW
ncbi:hypothetical protein SARC_03155 [Sphaeroforma arctica JP610]|uniref:Rho GDP-dissociation inhibitor n=1 Tax=Sphaeroforma arctica JP610 TaxID=667725 RepID=A0A0L0G6I6_9EUKA|nr:hypothetical protein SARC_03155 [Sphaeroforma arctica JP610]KNC84625.1 hypothetical protein SARC_03155 [Sphaeroforma arctica JP610]|eukprot:XP_014158527.1 hypothetical protein SARC_03155 [Sphaeroforma arctica JP610]